MRQENIALYKVLCRIKEFYDKPMATDNFRASLHVYCQDFHTVLQHAAFVDQYQAFDV